MEGGNEATNGSGVTQPTRSAPDWERVAPKLVFRRQNLIHSPVRLRTAEGEPNSLNPCYVRLTANA